MDHAHLERFLDGRAHGRRPPPALVRRIAHHHDHAAEGDPRLERLQHGRAAGEPAVHQERAVDLDGGKGAGHRRRREERVDRHGGIVEDPLVAPLEVGRGDEQAHRRGADAVDLHRRRDEVAQGAGVEERARPIERHQGEPARQEAREEDGRPQRIELVAVEPAPQRLEPLDAPGGDHRPVERPRRRARDERDGQPRLDEGGGHAGLPRALGAAARQHQRHRRIGRRRARPRARAPARRRSTPARGSSSRAR